MSTPPGGSHRVAGDGLQAWAAPDPAAPRVAVVPAGTEVRVVERRGEWARIATANGWSAWVDGRRLAPTEARSAEARPGEPGWRRATRRAFEVMSRNPIAGAAAALVVSGAVGMGLWSVLRLPAQAVDSLTPKGNCVDHIPGTTAMWLCSGRVAAVDFAGPIGLVVSAFVFRRPLSRAIGWVRRRLPRNARFLVAPVASTALFTAAFAEIHRETAAVPGFVSQRLFPAVVGLSAFVLARALPWVVAHGQRFFTARDRIPGWVRVGLCLAMPLGAAYSLNNQSRVGMSARKEQAVILLAMVTAAVGLTPRAGMIGAARASTGTTPAAPAPQWSPGAAPVPPPSPEWQWRRTHVVPAGGLPAWDRPDPTAPPVAQLPEGGGVELVRTYGEWAEVRWFTGWTGWVAASSLLPDPAGRR